MVRSRELGHREFISEINIVPLLDILLVLLLIFIVTAPIITQGVVVELPEATESQEVNTNNDSPVIIEVFGVGQYSVLVEQNRMDQLPPEQLVSETRRYLSINPKTIFLIGGVKNVPYNEIIKVLNLLRRAGVKSVGLMTKPI